GLGPAPPASKVIRDTGILLFLCSPLRMPILTLSPQTENLFHTYSQFATVPKIPPKPSEGEERIESQLQDILQRVRFPVVPPPRTKTREHLSTDVPLSTAAGNTYLPTCPPPRLRIDAHLLGTKTKQPLPPPRNPPRPPPRA